MNKGQLEDNSSFVVTLEFMVHHDCAWPIIRVAAVWTKRFEFLRNDIRKNSITSSQSCTGVKTELELNLKKMELELEWSFRKIAGVGVRVGVVFQKNGVGVGVEL